MTDAIKYCYYVSEEYLIKLAEKLAKLKPTKRKVECIHKGKNIDVDG